MSPISGHGFRNGLGTLLVAEWRTKELWNLECGAAGQELIGLDCHLSGVCAPVVWADHQDALNQDRNGSVGERMKKKQLNPSWRPHFGDALSPRMEEAYGLDLEPNLPEVPLPPQLQQLLEELRGGGGRRLEQGAEAPRPQHVDAAGRVARPGPLSRFVV